MNKATYNITSNRLFFWPEKGTRLAPADYDKCKAAGFVWWPRGCFTALWSPRAEDWIHDQGATIEEDDSPDNVEGRVEKYAGYAERAEESAADAARRAMDANTERRARLADNRATNEAERAAYWTSRIAGSIARAEQHDSPQTCKNRVKGIEADKRKREKQKAESVAMLRNWNLPQTPERANRIANAESLRLDDKKYGFWSIWSGLDTGKITPEQAAEIGIKEHTALIAYYDRWLNHYAMRLEYESAYAVACGADLTPAPRKQPVKRTAPDDGLKKGVKVTFKADYWGHGKDRTGVIASLGADNVKITPDAGQDFSPYAMTNGYKCRRQYVKKAA